MLIDEFIIFRPTLTAADKTAVEDAFGKKQIICNDCHKSRFGKC
jgi:hypothetical protein